MWMRQRGLFFVMALAVTTACGGESAPDSQESSSELEGQLEQGIKKDLSWPQWGQNQLHSSALNVVGQPFDRELADIIYDPLVPDELAANNGNLLAHYQVPLVDGHDVYMMGKDGTYTTTAFNTQLWSQTKYRWVSGVLSAQWKFMSDWVPPGRPRDFWEPVFHPALANGYLYVPGAGGTLVQVNKDTGQAGARINPHGQSVNPNIFTVSPITADDNGNLYYNTVEVPEGAATNGFYAADVIDSWLVKVTKHGHTSKVSYRTLIPHAPGSTDQCEFGFTDQTTLPWPPPAGTIPLAFPCGSVRTGLNVAPAVAKDGTIYTAARTHFNDRFSYLVAIKSNLKPKWVASLRDRFTDGCGVSVANGGTLPPNGTPGGCRAGAPLGVDPQTGRPGDGRVSDSGSSSPTVAPDGSIFLGTFTRYNYAQGHLTHFRSNGQYLGAYFFGWDITPAIYEHGSTYSVVTKDNHYSAGSYCNNPVACPGDRSTNNPASPEEYRITQLNPALQVEWSYKATNTESCQRQPDGQVTCVSDHPNSFEWCMNAAAVDKHGVVYANSEDGWLYALKQGGTVKERVFQQLALGAAYTPTSLGADGKVYSQNAGHLFVVGR